MSISRQNLYDMSILNILKNRMLFCIFRRQNLRMNQLSTQGAQSPLPPPRTFPSAFPWLRLDRIYQRGFAVRSAKVLRGRPWSQLSDHAPILAELELP